MTETVEKPVKKKKKRKSPRGRSRIAAAVKKFNGRPTEYIPSYHNTLAFRLALLNLKDTQICDIFGISEQTLNAWKKEHPNFLVSLNKGKERADSEIAKSLYHRALGRTVKEETIERGANGEIKSIKQTTKELPPDVTACIFWLKNRHPNIWRDFNKDVGSGDVHINLTDIKITQIESMAYGQLAQSINSKLSTLSGR